MSLTFPGPWLRRGALPASLAAAALLLGACGSQLGFTAVDGAHDYKRLSRKTPIEVLADEREVSGRYEVLGTLDVTVDPESAYGTRDAVVERFQKSAAKNGCDRVVGVNRADVAVESTRRETVAGEHGKTKTIKVPVTLTHHRWTARCVRTEAAPGGLKSAPGEVAPTPTTAPVPPPSTDAPPPAAGDSGAPATAPAASTASPLAKKLWARMAPYGTSYLRTWEAAFIKPPITTMVVLEAFNEVMARVTGPGGFWLSTVPDKWFGCLGEPDRPECKRIKKAHSKLKRWDELARSLAAVQPAGATAWLEANHARVERYLDEVVPATPSATAMEQTPFYRRHVAK